MLLLAAAFPFSIVPLDTIPLKCFNPCAPCYRSSQSYVFPSLPIRAGFFVSSTTPLEGVRPDHRL
jgi:hypothetical protein